MSAVGRSWSMFLVPFWAAFEKNSFFFAIFSQPSLLSFRKCSVSSPSDGKTARWVLSSESSGGGRMATLISRIGTAAAVAFLLASFFVRAVERDRAERHPIAPPHRRECHSTPHVALLIPA